MTNLHEKCRRIALVAFAAFLTASATQTGCTSTVASGPPEDATCKTGEVARKLGSLDACCTGEGASAKCYQPEALRVGDPCTSSGEMRQASVTEFVPDVCVIETCDGNRTSADFADTSTRSTGTLLCDGTWKWSGTYDTQTVVRACTVTETVACSGSTYGYDYGKSGYDDGYGSGYGYYGGNHVTRRTVSVVTSTCAKATADQPSGSSAPAACAAGTL